MLDRNGNSTIGSGRKRFGVDMLKSNGQPTAGDFDAPQDLSAHRDGKIDVADSVFANLRIWRDLNQDGSQVGRHAKPSRYDVVLMADHPSPSACTANQLLGWRAQTYDHYEGAYK